MSAPVLLPAEVPKSLASNIPVGDPDDEEGDPGWGGGDLGDKRPVIESDELCVLIAGGCCFVLAVFCSDMRR